MTGIVSLLAVTAADDDRERPGSDRSALQGPEHTVDEEAGWGLLLVAALACLLPMVIVAAMTGSAIQDPRPSPSGSAGVLPTASDTTRSGPGSDDVVHPGDSELDLPWSLPTRP